jgi:hypothetical protein
MADGNMLKVTILTKGLSERMSKPLNNNGISQTPRESRGVELMDTSSSG